MSDAIERIRAALANGQTSIRYIEGLTDSDLELLPAEIGDQLLLISGLNLAFTQVSVLPEWLVQLPELTYLNLMSTQVSVLPEWLGQLTALTDLDLSRTQVSVLPESLGQLTALTDLDLSRTQVSVLPESLGQLSRLERLNLSSTSVTGLPDSLGQLNALTSLDLSFLKLTVLPDWLGDLVRLTRLTLVGTAISVLPDWVGRLRELTSLNLSDTEVSVLPDRLVDLTELTDLNLSSTRVSVLPNWLGRMTKLVDLDLSYTPVSVLPDSLRQLTRLAALYLAYSNVSVLPDWIGGLVNLKRLGLMGTGICELPVSLGTLPLLVDLDMDGCGLDTLPSCIWNLVGLRKLDLRRNRITSLSSSVENLSKLEEFWLQDNDLTELPREIGGLSNLVNLDVSHNRLPPEIQAASEAGTDELLRYLRAVYEDGQRISEAKLVFVGEGNVGKSSLLGALLGEPFVKNRVTTHGIEIKPLTVTCEDTEILLNCWDFGGQPVYRPTHQLFFTKPAVYLVVWKPREGPELGQVEYWLSLIKDRAGAEAQVHVVASHGGPGQRPAQLDRSKLLTRFGAAAEGGMIAGFHHVDSETGAGVEELREAIATTAGTLPHVTRWYPGSWLRVRKALAEMDEAYLRYADFLNVAKAHDLSETAARSLARNAHALGQMIYYDDDQALRDLVVLKADWLSVAIGFVLEDEDTEHAGGLLPHRRLPQIWADPKRDSQHRYSHELQQMFLRLMERFDLTYRAPELANEPLSLVTQLLPGEPPPQLAEEWAAYRPGTSEVVQVCQFVEQDTGNNVEPPTGLMARLIALFHRHSLGRKDIDLSVHWLHGLVLEDRYGARALLSMDSTGLTIRVKGVNPDAFLSHLVHETRDYVEGFWVGRRTQVFVPCSESCEATAAQRGRFDLDRLYRRLDAGKKTAECHGAVCENDVVIADLLAPFGGRGPRDADEQARVVVREALSGALAREVGPMLQAQTEQILRSQRTGVDEIKNGLWEIGDQLDEQTRKMFSQLEGRLAVILRAFDDEANDGPRLFELESLDKSLRHPDVTKRRMRLTLWCEHSRLPLHLLEPAKKDFGVYTVEVARDWWVKAAPLIKTTSTLLKALLPIGLPVIKADLDDTQWKAVEERYTLGKEALGAAATLGADADAASAELDNTTGQPILAEGGLLRTLHAELRKQDITYADLRKVRGEGHRVLWVHPRFEPLYNLAPPRIPT